METLLLLLGLTFGIQTYNYNPDDYRELWQKIDIAASEGKFQTAVLYLKDLEKITIENNDPLETLAVIDTISMYTRRYNWNESQEYHTKYTAYRDSIFTYLDSKIEQYANHPRVINLIAEKIERIKKETDDFCNNENLNNTDFDSERDRRYKMVRRLCEKAIALFPNSPSVVSLKNMIDKMDKRSISVTYNNRIYPGKKIIFNITSKNISSINVKIYKIKNECFLDGETLMYDLNV